MLNSRKTGNLTRLETAEGREKASCFKIVECCNWRSGVDFGDRMIPWVGKGNISCQLLELFAELSQDDYMYYSLFSPRGV